MPALAGEWTAEMVRALPEDGNRYEVIDGQLFVNGVLVPGGLGKVPEIVTPSPSWDHQAVAAALWLQLDSYVRKYALGRCLLAPADVEYASETVVQPDVFVVPLVGGKKPRRWEDVRHLLLAIEVLSASSSHTDRVVKRVLYQREGVPEYWIVDLDARLIERWRPEDDRPEILADRLTWHPAGAAEPVVLDLARLFSDALD